MHSTTLATRWRRVRRRDKDTRASPLSSSLPLSSSSLPHSHDGEHDDGDDEDGDAMTVSHSAQPTATTLMTTMCTQQQRLSQSLRTHARGGCRDTRNAPVLCTVTPPSVSLSSSSSSPSAPSLSSTATTAAAAVVMVDEMHARALVAAGKYSEAYLALSDVLQRCTHAQHEAQQQQQQQPRQEQSTCVLRAALHARRAQCSVALMNYAECIDDCKTCVHCLCSGRHGSSNNAALSPPPSWLLDMYTSLVTALVLREQYDDADDCLSALLLRLRLQHDDTHVDNRANNNNGDDDNALHALPPPPPQRQLSCRSERWWRCCCCLDAAAQLLRTTASLCDGNDCTSVHVSTLRAQHAALTAVRRFCQHICRAEWSSALRLRVAAAPWLDAQQQQQQHTQQQQLCMPLRLLLGRALLESGDIDAARELLTCYAATLSPPPPPLLSAADAHTTNITTTMSAQRALLARYTSHYIDTLLQLATASVYSGRAYNDLAATLVVRCLRVQPQHTAALALGALLVDMEAALTAVDEAVQRATSSASSSSSSAQQRRRQQRERDEAVVQAVTRALRLDARLTRVHAQLLVLRAQAYGRLGKLHCAIDDCTRSLAALTAHRQHKDDDDDNSNNNNSSSNKAVDVTVVRALRTRARAYAALSRNDDAAADRRAARVLQTSAHEKVNNEDDDDDEHDDDSGGAWRNADDDDDDDDDDDEEDMYGGTSASSSTTTTTRVTRTHYDVLGVPRCATRHDIRQRYKQLTLRCHPDRVVGQSMARQQRAAERFKAVHEAYCVLSDAARRAVYDASLAPLM